VEQSFSGAIIMPDLDSSLAQLDELADELAQRGDVELAKKARATADDLRSATGVSSQPAPELISPDDAAKLLGIRSSPMVMRWAREKQLEGFNVGGRVKVSRVSVERLLDSAIVARQREYERDLAEVLDAFDVGDGPAPESVLPHIGHAPWDSVDARKL